MPLLLVALLVILFSPGLSWAQLQSPEVFLGYRLGERFTPHHRIEAYFEHVAANAPERVQLARYGETYEGRPLFVAFVASPENLARLESIRQSNLALAGMAGGTPLPDAPALVWLSYNVHGNEAVSSEAAMQVLHTFASGEHAAAQGWLTNTVLVIDPVLNPDGRERYVSFFTQRVGAAPDPTPEAREHREPWPGGRANHYLFDLNRDWAWGTQQETRGRVALYRRWMPHVHADFHEQGVDAPYYFAPAAEPFHAAITPWQRELQTLIGERNAATFDAANRLYFTREVFDLFYPSYGDTWPTFNGAVGMTYEQGGSGRAGLAILNAEGDTLTLGARIRNHFDTSMGTVEVASRNRDRVVESFRSYFEDARAGDGTEHAAYVVPARNGLDKLRTLARVLEHNGIRYGLATRRSSGDAFRYRDGTTGRVTVEEGDLVVDVRQPGGTLARVLFEPDPALPDTLTYDITAWALPYAHDLDAYAMRAPVEASGTLPPVPTPPASTRPYAYAATWNSFEDACFLSTLLREGIRARVSQTGFSTGGREYPRGTLVLTRTGHEAMGDRFDEQVRAAAERFGQELTPLNSGYVATGSDFGASSVAFVDAPRVMVLAGDFASSLSFGEVWHFFDQQLGYPATIVDERDLNASTLADYDVLVLPSGSYSRVLDDERLGVLRTWVQNGGRLIALESAAVFLAGKEGFGLKRKAAPEAGDSLEARLRPYGERERRGISGDVPGAIYRVRLDATHPLAFGYGDTYHALLRSSNAFEFLENGWNVGVVREDARVSGFAGAKAQEQLQEVLLYGVEERGRGQIIYLLDSPLFRGFWEGGKLLFSNAVFLVGR